MICIDIHIEFEKFKHTYKELIKNLDGINGDCKIYSELLAKYFKSQGFSTQILCLNKGIHYWVEVGSYAIDCRGVFKNRENLIRHFKKYITKERIQIIKNSIN